MFNYIKGNIAALQDGLAVVEVAGIGYEVSVSNQTLSQVASGDSVKLFTYLAVREDGISLYGFLTAHEKNMFLKLIAISGVGAKVALSILSGLSIENLCSAVSCADTAALASIKGIGKKTAERIVLELKDKISAEFGAFGSLSNITTAPLNSAAQEAILALVQLGYAKSEAVSAVGKVANLDNLTVEEIIILALK